MEGWSYHAHGSVAQLSMHKALKSLSTHTKPNPINIATACEASECPRTGPGSMCPSCPLFLGTVPKVKVRECDFNNVWLSEKRCEEVLFTLIMQGEFSSEQLSQGRAPQIRTVVSAWWACGIHPSSHWELPSAPWVPHSQYWICVIGFRFSRRLSQPLRTSQGQGKTYEMGADFFF